MKVGVQTLGKLEIALRPSAHIKGGLERSVFGRFLRAIVAVR
jgi:hypothetical protein